MFALNLFDIILLTFHLILKKPLSKRLWLVINWHFLNITLGLVRFFIASSGVNHEIVARSSTSLSRVIRHCIFLSFQISYLHVNTFLNFQLVNIDMRKVILCNFFWEFWMQVILTFKIQLQLSQLDRSVFLLFVKFFYTWASLRIGLSLLRKLKITLTFRAPLFRVITRNCMLFSFRVLFLGFYIIVFILCIPPLNFVLIELLLRSFNDILSC